MVGFNAVLLVGLGFLGLPSLWAPGPAANGQGNKAYRKGQYDEALQQYQKAQQALPAEKILALNSGTALLGAGKPQEALSALMSASADPRRGVQSRALYNAGNALADGKQLEEALDTYRRAILADPKNQDAKFNYELMKRRLQEQQKKDQDKKDKDKDKNQDQKKDQKDKDEQQQDQEKKDQEGQDQDKKDQDKKDQQDQPPRDPQDPQNQPAEPKPPQEQPAGMMSRQEAERLLDALKDNEIKQLKEKLKSKRRKNVDKDW